MFTPIKPKDYGVDDTVLDTPRPQATSTVRRKSPMDSRFRRHSNEEKDKQDPLYESESQKDDRSSLGLLDNMSGLTNISTEEDEKLNYPNLEELEYARRLLQKCSEVKNSCLTTDTNKENNANVQNITGNVSNFTLPIRTYLSELDKECMHHSINKVSATSVTFEPNEITARSSGISSKAEIRSSINKSCYGIGFNKSDIMAQLNNEMMAQINNEEFLSGSKISEQLAIDEACWQQDRTYCMPVANPEPQKTDFGSLSGFIGELELSLESCAGRKVSIGQYFERKSGNIGVLENNNKVRPSFGVVAETPVRRGKLPALVESTIVADATASSTELEKENTLIPNATRDLNENSVISLSTIINTLHGVESETPRRLIDQLLMAEREQKEKKKNSIIQDNARKETYTLPSNEKSILAMSTECHLPISNKFESVENLSTKLSLDSKKK